MAATTGAGVDLQMELDRSYRVLGLRTDADLAEVRTAYKKLALMYHPDRNRGPEAARTFAVINEAYNIIIKSPLVPGSSTGTHDHEDVLYREDEMVTFSILRDQERAYRVSRVLLEGEIRKRFNPSLATGVYCKVGGRWFEVDTEHRSTWSAFRMGSGKGAGLIEWFGPNKERWKAVRWEDFWSHVRGLASSGAHRPAKMPSVS